MADLSLFFYGMAGGLLLLTAAALARPGAGAPVRLWGALFALSVFGYVAWNAAAVKHALGPAAGLAWLLSTTSTGYFLLFARALLTERRGPDRPALAVLGAFTAIGIAGVVTPMPGAMTFWMLHQGLEFICYGYALWLAVGGWRDDLDEDRRRIRGPLILVITVYGLLQGAFETFSFFAPPSRGYPLGEAVALAGVAFAVPFFIMQTRWDRIGPHAGRNTGLPTGEAPTAPVPMAGTTNGLDATDRLELQRVLDLVNGQKAYREEGLTIAALAERVKIPEHRLRRLINGGLGFRNYAAFLNARRIAEAKDRLADPAQGRVSILTMALDLGYGSVGPFNRAFKEATGMTPTEFRRRQLAPKPE